MTIFLPREVAEPIEAVRREWDPLMAEQIAAHVTVVYPDEAPLSDLLVERLRAASPAIRPFRLRLGEMGCFRAPEGGVYVGVEDLDGGYRELRDSVLRPPFRASAFSPHAPTPGPRRAAGSSGSGVRVHCRIWYSRPPRRRSPHSTGSDGSPH